MRLLIAESDLEWGASTHAALSRAGYAADWVRTAVHMRGALATQRYDCAVLGLSLPDLRRDALLPCLRQAQPGLPVILVSSHCDFEDRVALLDQGVDDCLVHPFHLDELAARVRCLMRRTRPADDAVEALECGSIRLNPNRRSVQWAQRDVKLTLSEFSVLEALVRKKNQVVSRTQIEDALYGWGDEVNSNAVEVYVHFLRRKLYPGLILTVRGLGYQLSPDAN